MFLKKNTVLRYEIELNVEKQNVSINPYYLKTIKSTRTSLRSEAVRNYKQIGRKDEQTKYVIYWMNRSVGESTHTQEKVKLEDKRTNQL